MVFTMTDALRETEGIYLKEGWITPEQIKKIHREGFILATSLILLVATPVILLFVLLK